MPEEQGRACEHIRLAGGELTQVDCCATCGHVVVSIGAVSVRLSTNGFREVEGILRAARTALDAPRHENAPSRPRWN